MQQEASVKLLAHMLSSALSQSTSDPVLRSLLNIGLGIGYIFEGDFWVKNWWAVLASLVYFIGTYEITHRLMKIPKGDEKRRAWIMTFYSAILTAPVGFYMSGLLFFKSTEIDSFAQEFLFQTNAISGFMTVAFFVYMTLDIAVGMFHYPSTFELMNWLHHICYGILLLNMLKWNFANAFGVFLVHETPTILLALGHMNSKWRQDWLFGSLFFFIRVAYHGVLCYFITTSEYQPMAIWPVAWIILFLHLHWWAKWVAGMVRRSGINMAMEVHIRELNDMDEAVRQKLAAVRTGLADNLHHMKKYLGFAHDSVPQKGPSPYASLHNPDAAFDAENFLVESQLIEEAHHLGLGRQSNYGSIQRQSMVQNGAILLNSARFASNHQLPLNELGSVPAVYGSKHQGFRLGSELGEAAGYTEVATTAAGWNEPIGAQRFEDDEDVTLLNGAKLHLSPRGDRQQ